jgi:hypothetical protein
MTNPTQTPIADLSLAQVISLTQAGLISLKDGAPVYTGKADRVAKAGATKTRRSDVLSEVTAFFASPIGQSTRFFSIKPTSGMFAACARAINADVEASREDILWSLKQLEKQGLARQVGIKAKVFSDDQRGSYKVPVVVDVSEVNNFQRRWVHTIEATPAQDDSAE